MGIKAAVQDVLTNVRDAIQADVSALAQTRIGEERGWDNPACFLHLDEGPGVEVLEERRTGEYLLGVHVKIVVVKRTMAESSDEDVIDILGDIIDNLDARGSVGDTMGHDVVQPMRVAPTLRPSGMDNDDQYKTVGASTLRFRTEATRDLPNR